MTTYYTITINDSQKAALDAALAQMIAYCDQQLRDEPDAPDWCHRARCRELQELLAATEPCMRSAGDFFGGED